MSLGISVKEIVDRVESTNRAGLLGCHDSWVRVPLGNVATIINGAAFKSQHFNTNQEGLPLIRIRDVGSGGISTYYSGDYEQIHAVKTGDLLVGMDGDFRTAPWHGPASLLNQRVCRVEVDERFVSQGWIRYVLQGYLDAIWEHTSAITVKHLSSRTIAEIPIPLPPLAEQHRIVEALEEQLSRLDACNFSLSSAERKLAHLVDRIITAEVDRFKTTMKPLREFLSAKPRNGRSVPTADQGFPVLRLSALRGDKVDLAQFKIGDWSEVTAEPFLVQHKDILLSRGNGSLHLVGRAALVKDQPGPVAYPDTMIRLQPDLERLDPAFFVRFWNSPSVRHQIEAQARTTAGIYKINQSILQAISFPDLSIDIQRRISSEIDDLTSQNLRTILAVESTKVRSARLRAAVLASAFDGTLVDQDPADEPASVLLERIATERANAKPAVRRRTSVKAKS